MLGMRARKAGPVGTDLEPISPHELRAGFITTADSNGVADEQIMGTHAPEEPGYHARLRPPCPAQS